MIVGKCTFFLKKSRSCSTLSHSLSDNLYSFKFKVCSLVILSIVSRFKYAKLNKLQVDLQRVDTPRRIARIDSGLMLDCLAVEISSKISFHRGRTVGNFIVAEASFRSW